MKADAQEALKLAEEWWVGKETPTYIKVEILDLNEVDEFTQLYNRCFLTAPDPFCALTPDEAKQLNPEGIFVAKLADTLVGFIACFVEKKEDSTYGEITGIGVHPSRRRHGIATALIKHATTYFLNSGVEEVYCEVFEENTPSLLLVTTYGFRQIGRRNIPINTVSAKDEKSDLPGGKIMRRLGLRPRIGCETCRDI